MKISIFKKLWNKIKAFFNRIFKIEEPVVTQEKEETIDNKQSTLFDDFILGNKILMEDIVELNNADRDYTNILLYDDMTIINPSHSTEAIIEDTVETELMILDLDKDIGIDKENLPPKINVTEEIFDNGYTVTDIIQCNASVHDDDDRDPIHRIFIYRENKQLYFKLRLQSPTREKTIIEKVNVINKSNKDIRNIIYNIGEIDFVHLGEERKYGLSMQRPYIQKHR